jgi:hypothetical protein
MLLLNLFSFHSYAVMKDFLTERKRVCTQAKKKGSKRQKTSEEILPYAWHKDNPHVVVLEQWANQAEDEVCRGDAYPDPTRTGRIK